MELLLPAGDRDKAMTVFAYGADAVYLGLSMFSLRTRENKITEKDIEEIVAYAHKNNKKVYVTLNAYPHQSMMKLYEKHLKFLEDIKPDGIIFADFGVLALANEFAPSVEKHLSVQTSTMNVPAIRQWQGLGVSRIICAREMSLREVKEIHEAIPEMEIEYFVHGAVCMAYSGRCLLSTFTSGRDSNCGACNHTCRWNYQVYDEEGRKADLSDHHLDTETDVNPEEGCAKSIKDFEEINFVEEEQRQGEMVPIEKDFHGTHIMSSRDMCMIELLKDIYESGVCSLKVEGRNKTAYYAATVARAYREALDDAIAGKPFNPELWEEIHATANRGFFPGFARGKPLEGDIQYEANRSLGKKEFAGRVISWSNGRAEVQVKNRIKEGSEIEFVLPKRSDDFSIEAQDLKFGEDSVEILHPGNDNKVASILCEKEVPVGTFIRQASQERVSALPLVAAESYRG